MKGLICQAQFFICSVLVAGAAGQMGAQKPPPASADNTLPTIRNRQAAWRVLRSFDDPGTAQQWFLLRDPSQPARPAKLIVVVHHRSDRTDRVSGRRSHSVTEGSGSDLPLVRAGDKIVLSEHSPGVESRFEATALSTASLGHVVSVRVDVWGRVLQAVVTGDARAEIQAEGVHE